ncbi:GNAT family N-acetyltransferase [Bacillus sp. 165]|uniref:GNAT family N-acetyltransferase n=1 Tax=Bacillus sp. 165 TaxID=1529117 RepID=UPI001ADD559C|nr:GNAT family N-acetyltransferase [Bacillus sp. 165]MBO9129798.1 GNAT family N-acetyltransferase [Bacillus sp. 165]
MNPLLLDFPTMFQTKRLLIRKPFPGDGMEVYEAIQSSKSILDLWMPSVSTISSEEQAEALIREEHARFLLREHLTFHMYHREEGFFIGALTLIPAWNIPKFELRFWLHSKHRRQGFMKEALAGAVNFAFEKLDAKRVEIRCDAANEQARSTAESTEFVLEGILQNERLSADNELRDTCIYAKVKNR